jgi:cytidylate kinase
MFNLAGEVLILTGPPGSGKTTTAQTLANSAGSPKVHLHSDHFWGFIKNGYIAPYLREAHEQNKVVIDVLAKAAERYAHGGYFVILDGVVGPWFLHPFKALTVPLHYIVLRPALEAAVRRCIERGGDTLSDPEPVTALYKQFSALGELERHVIRTDGHTPDVTLSAVIAVVQSGAFRLAL